MKKLCAFLVLAALCITVLIASPARSQGNRNKLRKNSHKIENSYIVVLNDDVVGPRGLYSIAPYVAAEMAGTHRGQLKHVYQNALNGFAVEMTAEEAERLSEDFRVAYVEEDGVVTEIGRASCRERV